MDNEHDSSHKPPTTPLPKVTAAFNKFGVSGRSGSTHSSLWNAEDFEECREEEDALDVALDTICKRTNVTIFEPEVFTLSLSHCTMHPLYSLLDHPMCSLSHPLTATLSRNYLF